MFCRFLIFLIYFQSFSQENTIYDNSYKFHELSNIGSPKVSFFPDFNLNDFLKVKYNILGSRIIEINKNNIVYDLDSLFNSNVSSKIKYISNYNDGGLVKCDLNRYISKNSYIKFYYNNLSSLGFFQNQENKFSNLGFELYSFNTDSSYIFHFSFNSLNGFYNENGGIQNIESGLSNDLLSTYINSAIVENKIRNYSFDQFLKLDSINLIKHNFKYNRFNRKYNDPNPGSFHYSLTPLSFEILSYNRSNYFHDIENSLSLNSSFFLNSKIDYSLVHRLYYHNLIENLKYGDFIFSISNLNNKLSVYNFSFSFCPLGHNKNNYDFRSSYKFDFSEVLKSKISILLNKQKPNIFSEKYDTGLSTDWINDFNSTSTFSIDFENYLNRHDFDIKFNYKKIRNLLYFNNIAAPVQYNEAINYFHLHLKKDWTVNKFRINYNIHFQKIKKANDSNFEIVPVPFFLINQKLIYDFSLFKSTDFSSSIDLTLFTKYYANSYMPIDGSFYNQNQLKVGGKPLIQASLFLKKENFNIGVLVDNIHSLFFDKLYIIPDYIYNDIIFRLSINWKFID